MSKKAWLVMIVVIVVVIGGLIFGIYLNSSSRMDSKLKEHSTHAPSISNGKADNTIYVLADFSCPYCKTFEENILPEVKDKYIDNKKANIKFINASLLGDDSVYKSVVSYAILDKYPNKYWDFNKYMYKFQSSQEQSKTDIDSSNKKQIDKIIENVSQIKNIDRAMTQSGLSTSEKEKVNAAVKKHKSKAWKYAIKDRKFAKDVDIKTIPSVYINGEKVDDYRDVDSYIQYLE